MPNANYMMPESPLYDRKIRALRDDDPARASTVFNPLFQAIIGNIHALKLITDRLTGMDLSGVSTAYSELPLAAGLADGDMYLVQKDETYLDDDGNPQSTVYRVVNGAWERVGDFGIDNLQRLIHVSPMEPPNWKPGEWWYQVVGEREISNTIHETLQTVPYDPSKPYHIGIEDKRETIVNTETGSLMIKEL